MCCLESNTNGGRQVSRKEDNRKEMQVEQEKGVGKSKTKPNLNKRIVSLISAVLEKAIRTKRKSFLQYNLDSRRRRKRLDLNEEEWR